MATHSSILASRITWTEEPGGLQTMESQSQTRLKWLSTHRLYLGMLRGCHFLTSHVNNCPFTTIFWENFPHIFCLLWDMPYAWIEEQGV